MRFQGVQALRAIAALMVVVSHATFYASERLSAGFPVFHAETGIDLFFIVSGFVMVFSSRKLWADASGWKTFAKRRIIRIVPMYWLATTVKLLVMLASSGLVLHETFSLRKTILSYLFLPCRGADGILSPILSVGWTLCFEMLFYALFALAMFLRRDVYKFMLVTLGPVACLWAFQRPTWPTALHFYANTRIIEFLMGMLLAKITLQGRKCSPGVAYCLIAVGFFLLLPATGLNLLEPFALSCGIPATLVVFGVLSIEQQLKIPNFVILLGDASYVMYLFHPLISPIVPVILRKLHFAHPWVSTIGSIGVAITVGIAIHLFIEKPLTVRLSAPSKRVLPLDATA